MTGAASSSSTRAPRRDAKIAAGNPAVPAPTMIRSYGPPAAGARAVVDVRAMSGWLRPSAASAAERVSSVRRSITAVPRNGLSDCDEVPRVWT
jgi:hypothetical protein